MREGEKEPKRRVLKVFCWGWHRVVAGYMNEVYPIPVITAAIGGVAIDVGFDLVKRNGNIGFIELAVDRSVLAVFDFTKLSGMSFAIYGVEEYLTDYWSGDVREMQKRIAASAETKFHIGMEFGDMRELQSIFDIFMNIGIAG